MAGHSETFRLVRELEQQGFVVNRTGGDHLKVTKEGVKGCVFMPLTPSDRRSLKNTVSTLRQYGYDDGRKARKKKGDRE